MYDETQAGRFWIDFKHHATELQYVAAALVSRERRERHRRDRAGPGSGGARTRSQAARALCGPFQRGTIRCPEDIDAARRIVDQVHALLALFGPAWTSGALSERLGDLEAHSDELRAMFGQARQLVQLDPDAAITTGVPVSAVVSDGSCWYPDLSCRW